ncbi:glycine oxidase ThiO [Aquisphaera insulae]|uniref:glycine oxidase ThiO n=1 Tax=Aquisphaera insulae TaxID=2712864 RepID=UPI0013EB26D4|nr:glycine oxidase ThiO [Aquisphaera insulae]
MSVAGRDVVVVGGGVIGLSIAYALSREGIRCLVLDRRELGREASWAGAGLLPPPSEPPDRGAGATDSVTGLPPLAALRSWSASLYPSWSQRLQDETGIDNGYRRCGGVDVACDEAEERSLRATAGRWRAERIVHERLAAVDCARIEPALGPSVRQAYFLPDRAQVRNPRHLAALAIAASRRGAELRPWQPVLGLDVKDGRVAGVRVGSETIACSWVVMAAGAWSGGLLEGVGVSAPTPPVKGQIVLLRHDRPLLRRIVEHGRCYLVPRDDGRILVGATEEDAGFDTRPTAAGVRALIDEAIRLCPSLGRAEVERTWAGLRPGSIDSKPYIGLAPGLDNLIVATGHKRAGLQLSPATAELVAALILGRTPAMDLGPFRLDREVDHAEDTFRS